MTAPNPKVLYLEFRRENYTSQAILIPGVHNVAKGANQKARLITRQISSVNPRRSWRYYSFNTDPSLEPTTNLMHTVSEVKGILNEIAPFYVGYASGGWNLAYQPLTVEMSQDDINDIHDSNTPNALLRRVLKARAEAGFPDALFDDTRDITHPVTLTITPNADLKDAAIAEYGDVVVEKVDGVFPGLTNLTVATIAQETNPVLADILGEYSNKASVVRGRGAQGSTAKVAKVNEVTPESEGVSEYVRPNGQKYVVRKWGEHDDVMVLRKAREASQFVMLYGAPGTGKTALVEAAFGLELHTVLGSGDTEVADLVGGYVQTPAGGFEWVDGPLIKAAESGAPLLIDEIGLIDPKVLSIVYGLMDGRREYTVTANPERGTVKAKDGFYVVAATNPNAPGVRLSEALLSRFGIQAEVTTDWNIARKRGVSKTVVTVAQNLSKKQASGEVSWAPQFRELEDFQKNENLFGTSFAISTLLACAPEMDRPIVQDVLSRAFGENILPARI